MSDKKVLYCDSRGDKRFSAFYAKVNLDGIIDSIENFYQNSKRDEYGNIPGKGRKVSYMVFRSKKLPANKLTDFYKYLWKLYFQQNPELLEYASQFEEFIDRFKGKCINCQADVIKELVNKYLNDKKEDIKVENLSVKNLTACATGHRPSNLPKEYGYDYSNESWTIIINDVKSLIKELKINKAITGMALGFDTAFAIAVLQLQNEGYQIELHAAIPCRNQEAKWTDEAKHLYKAILKRCASSTILAEQYTPQAMWYRNQYMVDNSDIVIAMYDKAFDIPNTASGTKLTIEFAKQLNKQVINIFKNNKPTLTNREPIVGSQEVKVMKKVKSVKSLSNKLDNTRQKTVFEIQAEEEQKSEDYLLKLDELQRTADAHSLYIKQDPRKGVLERALYEMLMDFCMLLIKRRLIMFLEAEGTISELLNIEKYTYGFNENPTEGQVEQLKAAVYEFKRLLTPEVKEFIKTNNDITIYASNPLTRGDYISTYQRVLRMLFSVTSEPLDDFKDIINNEQDNIQEIILANEYEPLQVSYSENEEIEDEEYILVEC